MRTFIIDGSCLLQDPGNLKSKKNDWSGILGSKECFDHKFCKDDFGKAIPEVGNYY